MTTRMDEQYPPRRPTQAEITPATKGSMGLREWIIAFGVVISLTATATLTYWRLDSRVEQSATKDDVKEIGHKVDLVQITTRNQVDGLFQNKVKRFLMTCPREVLRSNSREIICPAVLLREDSQ